MMLFLDDVVQEAQSAHSLLDFLDLLRRKPQLGGLVEIVGFPGVAQFQDETGKDTLTVARTELPPEVHFEQVNEMFLIGGNRRPFRNRFIFLRKVRDEGK